MLFELLEQNMDADLGEQMMSHAKVKWRQKLQSASYQKWFYNKKQTNM